MTAPRGAAPLPVVGPSPCPCQSWRYQSFSTNSGLGAAADRCVVHAETTNASGIHHGHHGVAASLNHLAAILIAARASHHHPLFRHLETAHAHRHVAVHHHHAVHHHATADHAAAEHRAKILQHAGRHRVFARAHHFHAAVTLLHLHGATGNDHHVHAGGSAHWLIHGHTGHHHLSFHRHHCRGFLRLKAVDWL
jgi:hypothetical protein